MPNYHRSEKVEQVPAGSALQDGINILGQGCPPQRGLDGQLSWTSRMPTLQSTLTVHSYRRFLRFQWTAQPYQSGHASQSLYNTHEASSDLPQGIRLVQYLDDTLLVTEFPEALKA